MKRPLLELQVMWYTSFILILPLTSPPSCYRSSPSSLTSFFNLSSPISSPFLSRLSHSVSLYRSIAPSLPFSAALAFLPSYISGQTSSIPQSRLHVVNWLSWLHSSLCSSPSLPLYLPTRLIITSSTVELMAQFRKGEKKKEPCSPFIRSRIKHYTRDRTHMQHTCIYVHACMHTQREKGGHTESSWERAWWERTGRVRESCKYKPRKTPVVWFGQSRRRNALGCSVMQAPSNYLQPYQEEQRLEGDHRATYWARIKPDKYISVMITNTEPYTLRWLAINLDHCLFFRAITFAAKTLSVLDGSRDAWSDYPGFLCALTSFIQTHT